MQKKFIQHINQKSNIKKGSSIIVACSGGTDSMCLVDLLNKTKKYFNFNTHIIHINYNLRGKESNNDENRIINFAQKINTQLTIYSLCPLKKDENTLRDIRYKIFFAYKKTHNIDHILTGHNADDNTETILMNIIRGTGIVGLTGVPETKELKRPLLFATKKEIKHYLQKNNIPHHKDSSNNNNAYTRNKIRNIIIPEIKKINPQFNNAINNLSTNLKESTLVLQTHLKTLQDHIQKSTTPITLDKQKFTQLNLDTQKLFLKHILSKTPSHQKNITRKLIEEIVKNINHKNETNGLKLTKGLHLTHNHDTITLHLLTEE